MAATSPPASTAASGSATSAATRWVAGTKTPRSGVCTGRGWNTTASTATATIHNACLAETSAVYDGATPGSMILRARQMSEAGLIVPEMARQLEVQYRIKLPASQRSWPGMIPPKEETMAEKPEGQAAPPSETPTDPGILQAFHRSIAAALAEVPLPPESRADEPATLIRRLGAELIELRPLPRQGGYPGGAHQGA
jgi:hypothetical protein